MVVTDAMACKQLRFVLTAVTGKKKTSFAFLNLCIKLTPNPFCDCASSY